MHNHYTKYNKLFAVGIALNVIYIVLELVYGFISNSIALIADAGHNLSDVLGLLLAWGATYLAAKAPTEKRTYGYRKTTILASLINAVVLLIAVGAIVYEAVKRFIEPQPVPGETIIIVAAIGFVINLITALLFITDRKKDLNIKGAFLHMAADAGVSLGVAAGGLIILFTGWLWIDPLISLIVAVIITIGTWDLLRESLNLSLDAVPQKIDIESVRNYLQSLEGVTDVHDLHIWAMSTRETALTVHLRKPGAEYEDKFIEKINRELDEKFGIDHTTIQVEKGGDCTECNMNNV